jgi:GT2 family glycosyltransferase
MLPEEAFLDTLHNDHCLCQRCELKREPIQVHIPYDTEGRLARAYNRAMRRSTSEWVLFIDHDLFICNKYWYQICIEAVQRAQQMQEQKQIRVGWITAVTNRIGNPAQKVQGAPESHDLQHHCSFARDLYEKHGSNLERCKGAMSGFWILTNKTAWRRCGGFDEKRKRLLGVDNRYSQALSKAGYLHYRIPGLYVYHMYHQKKLFMRW